VIIIVSSLLFAHLAYWLLPGLLSTWNSQVTDQLFLLRQKYFPNQNAYNGLIVHVDETDASVLDLTGSYLTRQHYAQVARNLGELKTAVQIWDYVFVAPKPAEGFDEIFFESNWQSNNAYYGMVFDLKEEPPAQHPPRPEWYAEYLDQTKWQVKVEGDLNKLYIGIDTLLTFREFAESSKGLGFLSLRIDPDGVFRRAPLMVRYEDAVYPSFPFRAVCDYLQVPPENIILRPGKEVVLKNAQPPGKEPRDITIPVDDRCNIIVNFVGPWSAMTHYQLSQIYKASDDRDAMVHDMIPLFKGKIAVVSVAATGAADVGPVPTDNDYPLSGIHANVMHTILSEKFLREWTIWPMFGIEFLLLAAVFGLACRFRPRGLAIGGATLLAAYVLFVTTMFVYGSVIVNIVRPVLTMVLSAGGIVAYRYIKEEQQKEELKKSFESFLPPTIVKRIMANPESVLEVHKRELTILFSDIKSFTTYSSVMTPDRIQTFLAEYFEAMVEIVFKYEGTVDKYIGDGLMVFFGAPDHQPDHALRCVKAAIEMQHKCRELKEKWVKEGLFPLMIRIGINTGEVVVGNFGSTLRLSYTVLGSDVNLANRLESNAPVEGIMIAKRTQELIAGQIPTLPHEPIQVKGIDALIEVYTVPVDDNIIKQIS